MSVITITMGQRGEIHFPPHASPKEPELATGEWSLVQRLVAAHAAPGRHSGTWVVPGMSDAVDTDEALELYRGFRQLLAYQMQAATEIAAPPSPSPPPNLEKELERHLIELYRGAQQRQDMKQLVGVKVAVIRILAERMAAAAMAGKQAA